MRIRTLLSAADLQKIRGVTELSESTHAGEIVPYLVERVDGHHEARWRGATFAALLMSLLAGALHRYGGFWGGDGVLWITLPTIVGAALGYLLAGFASIGRLLLDAEVIDRRVQLRAEAAFLEEEVFRTRDRTGILIFLAVYERRAVILADAAIHHAVPRETWPGMVDRLVSGIRDGKAVDALCECIRECGEILQRHKVLRKPDDRNELNNSLRIRER